MDRDQRVADSRHLARTPWDEPPSFGMLGFIVTVEALFISLFVLISQGQQGERDRIRADLDYQVNLKAHQEVMQLHQKLDRLQRGDALQTGLQPLSTSSRRSSLLAMNLIRQRRCPTVDGPRGSE